MTAPDRERLGLMVTALVLALLLWLVVHLVPQERAQRATVGTSSADSGSRQALRACGMTCIL